MTTGGIITTLRRLSRSALVAGATGLIGSHVLQLLLADNEWSRVVTVGRRPVPQLHQKLQQRVLRSEEHTSELQSRRDIVCRLLLENKKKEDHKVYKIKNKKKKNN